jgi:ribosomal protein S18 acetylase RimI-like enzyme
MQCIPAVTPAQPQEWEEALHLLFHYLPPGERTPRISTAMYLLSRGELDPEGFLVARGPAGFLGAMVCLPVPGASGLVWPPQAVEGPSRQVTEDRLVAAAVGWLRRRGAKLGQSLLTPAEAAFAAPLERNGFVHITTLWYVQHHLDLPVSALAARERLTYWTYQDLPDRDLFQRTLLRTYIHTQDCPEVSGARSIDEVMEGHRAQGKYDPGLWWLALWKETVVGVLLVVEMPEWGSWDVAYVGVVPEMRGRGFGRELMLKALFETRAAGVSRLTLSVDARNRPAWKLYTDLGFEPHEQREVYLAVWR